MSTEDQIRRQEEQQRQQQEFQAEQRQLQQAFNQDGELDRGWMEDILKTDDLEERLNPFTIEKVQAMLNKQWVLSNLTEAEAHDRWYKLEVMKLKVLGEHPPQESVIQGPIRAFLFDDSMERLNALTPQERNTIDQVIQSLQNVVTRGRRGFERRQLNTSIARAERETQGDDRESGGRLDGLFS